MASKSLNLRTIRADDGAKVAPRLGLRILAVFVVLEALLLIAMTLMFPISAGATPVKAEVSVSTSSGFGRFVFRFAEEIEADVRLNNGIVIITFKQPVAVSVDRISIGAPDYITAARRDPDGTAVRLALGRKVTVNSMAAGDRLYVDLLPEGWVGLPPSLPQEVIDDLARRAREAEKKERQRRQLVQQREQPPIRLRVGTQPTFTRYVFELPELVPVTADRAKDKLTLLFDGPLRFDIADAQASPPPTVASIETKSGDDNVSVRFEFTGSVDVRTFREDNNFIVDVLAAETKDQPGELFSVAPPAPPPPPAPPNAAPPAPPNAAKGPGLPARTASPAPAPPARDPPPPIVTPEREAPPSVPRIATEGTTAPPAVTAPPRLNEAEPPKPAVPPAGAIASTGPRPSSENAAPVVVEVRQQGEQLRLTFPFTAPTPAAVFRRADTVWLVFDTTAPIDVAKLVTQSIGGVRTATVTRSSGGQVLRIRVDRPKLTTVEADGPIWTVTLGDLVLEPTRPLGINRAVLGPRRASVVIPYEGAKTLHRLSDPEAGDTLLVVTALGSPRGFVRTQQFVEFRALASTQGVVIQPIADDLTVEVAADRVVIGRPVGLTLSGAGTALSGDGAEAARRPASTRPFLFDAQSWGFDRQADFIKRQSELVRAAASAPEGSRAAPRLELVRFYLARDMYAEAKAVLDLVLAEDQPKAEQASTLVLRAIANIMMGRSAGALKDLSNPVVGDQHDASVWRALANARQGKWVEAREGFKNIEAAIATTPIELQLIVYKEAVRAAIEVRDFADAGSLFNVLETLGASIADEPALRLLKGRIAEGLGRVADALASYHAAVESPDRQAAAQGRLREIVLRTALGELKQPDAIAGLEVLTTIWRGDDTEIEALQLLGRFYAEDGRYRDAFQVMRTVLTVYPRSDWTRRIQDQAAATFDALYLDGKGDAMPAIEALSLFYDFRELTPVGRRGDEMIRRLADRLVSVDLLDQAAALLQHQVDHRLQGAARAQIAVRLAVIYLMSRKPERAIQALRATRGGDLPNELRNQRLLLEARALSSTGRHDLALELATNMEGKEVDRLRADILWAARRWREAGEQIEKLYGDRWRDFKPLADAERADILRAGVALSLAEDPIGLDRFRQKYAAKMAEGPDGRAFEVATTKSAASSAEFAEIARKVSAIDTLESFLRDIRARFPPAGAASPQQPAPPPPPPRAVAPGVPRPS